MRRYLSLYVRVVLVAILAMLLHLVVVALPLYVAAAIFAPAPPPAEALVTAAVLFIGAGGPAAALLFAPVYAGVMHAGREGDSAAVLIGCGAGAAVALAWLHQMPIVLALFGASVGWVTGRMLRLKMRTSKSQAGQ